MVAKGKTKMKSKFSKKNKKAWRTTDIKDVETFYENQLLEERLGGPFSKRTDEELFFFQKQGDTESADKKKHVVLTTKQRKQRALEETPKCFESLVNISQVQDPISKRNRVKSHEERKSIIRKNIEEKLKQKGIVKKKELIAAKDRALHKKKVKSKPPPYTFDKDLWEKGSGGENIGADDKDWLDEDTIRHYATNTGHIKVKVPRSLSKKPSTLPSIEPPHPGISYNPTAEDHNKLLQSVVKEEMKITKEEAHVRRVTTEMFKKIPREQVLENWLSEMSQGLNDDEDDEEEEDTGEYKAVNPPALLKRKTLKKRKKAKLLKQEKVERQKKLVEKKKLIDMDKLRFMKRDILKAEEDLAKAQEKKKLRKSESFSKTKRLGSTKYSEPLLLFQRKHEIRRNLRRLNPEGSILADRFFSLQKRNLIEPRARMRRGKGTTKKKIKKPGFKTEDIDTAYNELIDKLKTNK